MSDKFVRQGFVRKVMGILSIQLTLTAAIIMPFLLSQNVNAFVSRNPGLVIASYITMVVTMLAIICCEKARRSFPTNYVLLAVFTMSEGFMLGCITASYSTQVVIMAVAVTAAMVFALAMYAVQTKYDFTACGAAIVLLSMAMIVVIILAITTNLIPPLLFGVLGATLASFYIVFDI